MATNSSIPAKYVPVLTQYASAILLQWQERKNEALEMFRQADARLCDIFSADDMQFNSRRIERPGI